MWQGNRGLQCRLGQKVTLSEKDSLEITRKALVNSLEKIEGFSSNSSSVVFSAEGLKVILKNILMASSCMYCHQIKIGDLFVLNTYYRGKLCIKMVGYPRKIVLNHYHQHFLFEV